MVVRCEFGPSRRWETKSGGNLGLELRSKRMKRAHQSLLAGFLLLSATACNQEQPVDNNADAIAPGTATDNTTGAVAPGPVTDNSAGAVAGGPPPIAANADAGGSIPAALQGRWGLTPADCTTTKGDEKGLLTITADSLKFYESRGTPGTSIESDDSGISGNFNFTGEGQSWSKYVSLKLSGDGLVRTERSPMQSYTYAKC